MGEATQMPVISTEIARISSILNTTGNRSGRFGSVENA